MKVAVVLFNLGGPDTPDSIEPFLRNLFSDPAVLPLPSILRLPLAKFIAAKRVPSAREIYAKIGGCSPILSETKAQAQALEAALGRDFRCFISMRCWKPFSDDAVAAIKAWGAEQIVLIPLYPQFSTATTGSSFVDWTRAAAAAELNLATVRICCYPEQSGFISALAGLIVEAAAKAKSGISYRLLLSAHGLPERMIRNGDPYKSHVEKTAAALTKKLGMDDILVCYQSRVGPMKWIGPATDSEIKRAGADGKGIIIAPIAFVSEHSETLVELDIEYALLAKNCGVKDYIRVPAVGIRADFIAGLAKLVSDALAGKGSTGYDDCGTEGRCGCRRK
jgi:protoporphyrin/coproporphyrin ferrochelatase